MDMIIILVGLALLLVLTLKKVPVVYAAAISVIFIALFSRLPVVSTMTGDYMTGFANFVKSSWLMLLLGAILSKVMDIQVTYFPSVLRTAEKRGRKAYVFLRQQGKSHFWLIRSF